MAKNTKKTETEELNGLLFDSLGDFVSPGSWTVDHPEGKRIRVICRHRPPSESLVKQAFEDVERKLKGTKFENKVRIFFPA